MGMKIERSVERAIIKWWQGLSVLSTCIHYWVDIIYERLGALRASESQPDHAVRTIPEPRALIGPFWWIWNTGLCSALTHLGG